MSGGQGVWGKGQSVPEEIRDLIKLPVWGKAFRCKADLYDNDSLSEFCSTKGSFYTLNYCGPKPSFSLILPSLPSPLLPREITSFSASATLATARDKPLVSVSMHQAIPRWIEGL